MSDAFVEQGLQVENVAVESLKRWLLAGLPQRCLDVNATRAAALRASTPGPYVIPVGSALQISTTGTDLGFAPAPLTSGAAVSATQLAADVNSALPGLAAVDDAGRFMVTSLSPPIAAGLANSVLSVGPDTLGAAGAPVGVNAALGWAEGGEKVVVTPIVTPTPSGIYDGWPKMFAPAAGQKAFRLVVDNVSSQPVVPDVRRDEYNVRLELAVLDPLEPNESHRTKEHVRAVVRALRGLMLSSAGRQLGRAAYGDVMKVVETSCVFGLLKLKTQSGSDFYDVASLGLVVKVFGRPPSS